MAIRRGSSTPSAIYRGATAVQRVMRGTVEVWSASIYPVSGTWGPNGVTSSYVTYGSHTIAEPGTYTITYTTTSTGSCRSRITGPGFISDPGPFTSVSPTSTTQTLSPGAVVNFQAGGNGTVTGSWSIVKN